ncbi:MAG: cysteine ABC transporter ATP-binding protein [Epulopiscium sp. Nele67-Bin005]|nr:MAG: cysteine ABC transporter ATP-binding protein [Epulopiscium sp. Nele67-Bin005]
MVNKRLIQTSPTSMKFIKHTVLYQWLGLIFNIIAMFTFAYTVEAIYFEKISRQQLTTSFFIILGAIIVRCITSIKATKSAYFASRTIKNDLRFMLYDKLLKIGVGYNKTVSTSKIIQIATEGVEQIEIYFGRYLPQLFYSLLAPITLFVVLSTINFKVATVLILCVPLIPISIIAINKFAKRLFKKYWGAYTELGDHFLDNLNGLNTLKVYSADENYHKQMNEDAEHFRKITMKVLTMQLNSVTLMDLIAYGGAALGIGFALVAFSKGQLTIAECLFFILLTSEFFIPLRLLGSYFHVAMNGMSASQSIFEVLDTIIKEETPNKRPFNSQKNSVEVNNLSFSYDEDRQILKDISLNIPNNGLFALVGQSGCGKSTLATLLMGFESNYKGEIKIGDIELNDISIKSFRENSCVVKHQNYLFRGTIKENLLMANKNATDEQLWNSLKKVKLDEFVKAQGGLDYILAENGGNLSGGQRQRIALARALVYDAPMYIFDEATSNIDIESEEIFNQVMLSLAKEKLIIVISHRLANVIPSDIIFVLEEGKLIEQGKHNQLLNNKSVYYNLFKAQSQLEDIYKNDGGAKNE